MGDGITWTAVSYTHLVNDLNNQTAGYAIMDMLAENRAYFASGRKVTVPRTQTELSSVRVLSADTEEDLSQAVVKLVLDGRCV